MKLSRFFTYLLLILMVAGGAIWYIIDDYYARQAQAKISDTKVVMYKNPGCQCCDRWADYMEDNGFTVTTTNEAPKLPAIKAEHSISQEMAACHTAFVGGYVVEGHVPAGDIKRLLNERPKVAGLAVPGMPASSPGMNTAPDEPFYVYIFDNLGAAKVFAKY